MLHLNQREINFIGDDQACWILDCFLGALYDDLYFETVDNCETPFVNGLPSDQKSFDDNLCKKGSAFPNEDSRQFPSTEINLVGGNAASLLCPGPADLPRPPTASWQREGRIEAPVDLGILTIAEQRYTLIMNKLRSNNLKTSSVLMNNPSTTDVKLRPVSRAGTDLSRSDGHLAPPAIIMQPQSRMKMRSVEIMQRHQKSATNTLSVPNSIGSGGKSSLVPSTLDGSMILNQSLSEYHHHHHLTLNKKTTSTLTTNINFNDSMNHANNAMNTSYKIHGRNEHAPMHHPSSSLCRPSSPSPLNNRISGLDQTLSVLSAALHSNHTPSAVVRAGKSTISPANLAANSDRPSACETVKMVHRLPTGRNISSISSDLKQKSNIHSINYVPAPLDKKSNANQNPMGNNNNNNNHQHVNNNHIHQLMTRPTISTTPNISRKGTTDSSTSSSSYSGGLFSNPLTEDVPLGSITTAIPTPTTTTTSLTSRLDEKIPIVSARPSRAQFHHQSVHNTQNNNNNNNKQMFIQPSIDNTTRVPDNIMTLNSKTPGGGGGALTTLENKIPVRGGRILPTKRRHDSQINNSTSTHAQSEKNSVSVLLEKPPSSLVPSVSEHKEKNLIEEQQIDEHMELNLSKQTIATSVIGESNSGKDNINLLSSVFGPQSLTLRLKKSTSVSLHTILETNSNYDNNADNGTQAEAIHIPQINLNNCQIHQPSTALLVNSAFVDPPLTNRSRTSMPSPAPAEPLDRPGRRIFDRHACMRVSPSASCSSSRHGVHERGRSGVALTMMNGASACVSPAVSVTTSLASFSHAHDLSKTNERQRVDENWTVQKPKATLSPEASRFPTPSASMVAELSEMFRQAEDTADLFNSRQMKNLFSPEPTSKNNIHNDDGDESVRNTESSVKVDNIVKKEEEEDLSVHFNPQFSSRSSILSLSDHHHLDHKDLPPCKSNNSGNITSSSSNVNSMNAITNQPDSKILKPNRNNSTIRLNIPLLVKESQLSSVTPTPSSSSASRIKSSTTETSTIDKEQSLANTKNPVTRILDPGVPFDSEMKNKGITQEDADKRNSRPSSINALDFIALPCEPPGKGIHKLALPPTMTAAFPTIECKIHPVSNSICSAHRESEMVSNEGIESSGHKQQNLFLASLHSAETHEKVNECHHPLSVSAPENDIGTTTDKDKLQTIVKDNNENKNALDAAYEEVNNNLSMCMMMDGSSNYHNDCSKRTNTFISNYYFGIEGKSSNDGDDDDVRSMHHQKHINQPRCMSSSSIINIESSKSNNNDNVLDYYSCQHDNDLHKEESILQPINAPIASTPTPSMRSSSNCTQQDDMHHHYNNYNSNNNTIIDPSYVNGTANVDDDQVSIVSSSMTEHNNTLSSTQLNTLCNAHSNINQNKEKLNNNDDDIRCDKKRIHNLSDPFNTAACSEKNQLYQLTQGRSSNLENLIDNSEVESLFAAGGSFLDFECNYSTIGGNFTTVSKCDSDSNIVVAASTSFSSVDNLGLYPQAGKQMLKSLLPSKKHILGFMESPHLTPSRSVTGDTCYDHRNHDFIQKILGDVNNDNFGVAPGIPSLNLSQNMNNDKNTSQNQQQQNLFMATARERKGLILSPPPSQRVWKSNRSPEGFPKMKMNNSNEHSDTIGCLPHDFASLDQDNTLAGKDRLRSDERPETEIIAHAAQNGDILHIPDNIVEDVMEQQIDEAFEEAMEETAANVSLPPLVRKASRIPSSSTPTSARPASNGLFGNLLQKVKDKAMNVDLSGFAAVAAQALDMATGPANRSANFISHSSGKIPNHASGSKNIAPPLIIKQSPLSISAELFENEEDLTQDKAVVVSTFENDGKAVEDNESQKEMSEHRGVSTRAVINLKWKE